jgi:hypothetical protein
MQFSSDPGLWLHSRAFSGSKFRQDHCRIGGFCFKFGWIGGFEYPYSLPPPPYIKLHHVGYILICFMNEYTSLWSRSCFLGWHILCMILTVECVIPENMVPNRLGKHGAKQAAIWLTHGYLLQGLGWMLRCHLIKDYRPYSKSSLTLYECMEDQSELVNAVFE